MKTAIIYLRVSTGKQAEKELPLQSQLDKCLEKAEQMGAEVLEVFSDKGVSGRTDRRIEFQRAINYCEHNEVDYFVTWSTSRFARNMIEAKLNKDRLAKAGTSVEYVTVTIDHKSSSGFLHESILEIFDEYHSIQVSLDTTRSMRKNAQEGYWNGGTVPYGYKAVEAEDNPKRKRLVPDEVESSIVRRIFKARTQGTGFKSISRELNEAGITKRGKPWSHNSVHYILNNEILLGRTIYGRRDGRGNPMPEDDWIVINSHEPIISEDMFQAAKNVTHSPDRKGGTPKSNWLLSGLVTHECGCPMNIEAATGRSKVYYYYGCSGGRRGLSSCHRRIKAQELEDYILSQVLDGILTHENLRPLLEDMVQLKSSQAKSRDEKINDISKEIKPLKSKRSRLFELLENPDAGLNMGDLAPRLKELNGAISKLETKLAVLEKEADERPLVSNEELEMFAGTIKHVLTSDDVPVKLKRNFLAKFIQDIEITSDMAKISWVPEALLTVNPKMVHSGNLTWLPDRVPNRTAQVAHFNLPETLCKVA